MTGESRRSVRVARLIRKEVARILSREVQDPALTLVGITRVEVTDDLQQARVFFRLLASDDSDATRLRKDAERGFRRAAGNVRRHLGRALKLRSTPVLEFHYDEEVDHVLHVEGLLERLAEDRRQRGEIPEGTGQMGESDDISGVETEPQD